MAAVFVKEVGEGDGGVREVVNPGRAGWGSRPDIGVGEVAKVKVVTW